MVTVGVVGPRDLVSSTCRIVEDMAGVTTVALPYRSETQTAEVVRSAPGEVDAWLFTGVMPYELASAAGVLDQPASFVNYTGAPLLTALIQLMREGHDPSSFSVDILDTGQVAETLKEAGIATSRVHVLPYRRGLTSADIVAFHRERAAAGTGAAITCLRSAYTVL